MKTPRSFIFFVGFSTSQICQAGISFRDAVGKLIATDEAYTAETLEIDADEASNLTLEQAWRPLIQASIERQWSQNWQAPESRETINAATLSFEANLFAFGRDKYGQDLADTRRSRMGTSQQLARLHAEERAVSQILAYTHASQNLSFKNRVLASQDRLLSFSQRGYDQGRISEHDLGIITYERDAAAIAVEDARMRWTSLVKSLESRMGRVEINATWPLGSVAALQRWKGQYIQKGAAESNLALKAQQTIVEENALQENLATTSYLPTLDAFGTISKDLAGGQRDRQDVLGVALNFTLVDRGSRAAEASRSFKARQGSEMRLHDLKRQQSIRLSMLQANLETRITSLAQNSRLQQLANKLFETELRRYEGALIKAHELVLSEARLVAAEEALHQSLYELNDEAANYCSLTTNRISDCLN